MEVYTYSDARQRLAFVLDTAASTGTALIRRRDGSTFAVIPVRSTASPLDVPSILKPLGVAELVATVREGRERIAEER
ncbi:MAG: type II toxin-antitoxin system Phd/YefM family antitoxin [Armatimonadetes bacterium]|nr:type II toxin-antitoxin system Phd/YefM family antitoxin [Armatimonadota bacterium]